MVTKEPGWGPTSTSPVTHTQGGGKTRVFEPERERIGKRSNPGKEVL